MRQGPRSVLATYATALGLGFEGCYGLPGADRYQLVQLRRDLAIQLGVDPDRDWSAGAIREVRAVEVEMAQADEGPWFKSLMMGRVLAIFFLLSAIGSLITVLLGAL